MTPKQERFARAYIETSSGAEAYRVAYNASAMSPAAIAVEACRLLQNPKVALAVESYRAEARKAFMVSIESLTAELEAARLLAMADEKGASAAVAAVMGKAKLHGLLVDRAESTNLNYTISDEPMNADEWVQEHAATTH